jgi:hypothetical protein
MRLRRSLAVVAALALMAFLWYASNWNNHSSIPSDVLRDLRAAETFEMFSLDPCEKNRDKKEFFHGWVILGKTIVSSSKERNEILKALQRAAYEHDMSSTIFCFLPRHGIRVRQGERLLDLVICFQCEKLYVYKVEDGDEDEIVYLRGSAQPNLDEVLRRANVSLPKE